MTPTVSTPGLDLPALEAHVDAVLPGLRQGPLNAHLLAGGRSNLTYAVSDGAQRWVLRRPPLGHVLPTAHDVAREHRLLTALADTDVPVPRPLALGGPEVLGAPFLLMEYAEGQVLRDEEQLQALGPARARALAEHLVDVLATLHALDPDEVGLGTLGRPDGYLERQLSRWARQVRDGGARDLPELRRLGERLGLRVPVPQRASVVHGDYRLDNVVVQVAPPGVRAVLDWEMATLGDPLADLASTAAWWDGLSGLDSPVAAVPGEVPGFPASTELLARYAASSGADLGRMPWYLGFALYKIAAIFEGIHARWLAEATVGDGFDLVGALVPDLVARGHAVLDGDAHAG